MIGLLAWLLACGSAPTDPVDVLVELAAKRPFEKAAVEGAFGVSLARQPQSNDSFTVYAGEAAGVRVELREPVQPTPEKGGMVLLTLDEAHCLSAEALTAAFGSEKPGPVPHPGAPPERSGVREQPWGEVRATPLGGCARSVVLDAIR